LVIKIRGERKIGAPLLELSLSITSNTCRVKINLVKSTCASAEGVPCCAVEGQLSLQIPQKGGNLTRKKNHHVLFEMLLSSKHNFSQDEKSDLHAKFTLTQKTAKQCKKATKLTTKPIDCCSCQTDRQS